ncbi:MAG: bifunctional lysylphosphatidylglycerol flippase/synthetase MprF [Gammaproteobacteria bacterium]|nr:bifunctional lysylphosphatidylglycerol flippase/synthetase MprF [Gammaproteobacteria bacterium]MDH3411857.1 bifunctional lysylphosphatidylglycerol flippase/synthetase MprF [Gammaproteobacteria bacterium]
MNRLAVALILVIFTVSLFVLHHELATVQLRDVMAAFGAIPLRSLGLATVLAITSYIVLTGYDYLALRYIKKPLPYVKTAYTSFIAYAVGHNLGLAMLTGGSVRFRIYTAAGLSAIEVGQVVALCTVTFGLGVAMVLALVFTIAPAEVTFVIHIREGLVRAVGVTGLVLLSAYVAWNGFRREPFRIRGVAFSLPGVRLTLTQFALAGIDLCLASAVLFVLLPADSGLSYATFLGLYVIAMVAAILSHVPGGLGVFEAVLVAAAPAVAPSVLLGAVLAYRLVYYLIPLGIAAVMLAAHEIGLQRPALERLVERTGDTLAGFAPRALGGLIFATGAILLFSGATPSVRGRIEALEAIFPVHVVEFSHLVASVVGLALLILARGLFRRLDAAWLLAVLLLLVGAVASVLKGFDWEEAILLVVVFLVLLVSRKEFYRRASLTQLRFTPGWIAAIVLVISGSIWLGIFSYKHVDYSSDLWWHFAMASDAPRFLRASVLVVVIAVAVAGLRLMRPAPPAPGVADVPTLARAAPIVAVSPSSNAALAFVGDKRLLFNQSGNAFVMYGVQGQSWIAMGDPVGPEGEWPELLWDYRELVDRHGGRTVFYQIEGEKLPYYLDLGLSPLKLGEEGRVDLKEFSLQGSQRADLRQAKRRAEREGASFEVAEKEQVPSLLSDLERISNDWLGQKNTAEKRFSVGFFSAEYLSRLPCAIVRRDGVVVAFANIWPSGQSEELSIDLMRYDANAPKGVMDYLFVELMLWGQAQGYRWFDLGMAPLSGLDRHSLAPVWHRVGSFVFRHGEHFYNFEGLRSYKEKFDPEWRPRYLVSPGGFAAVRALLDSSILIAGGISDVVRS